MQKDSLNLKPKMATETVLRKISEQKDIFFCLDFDTDSINRADTLDKMVSKKEIIINKVEKPRFEASKIEKNSLDGAILIYIISLLFIIIPKVVYWKALKQFWESIFSITKHRLWLRDVSMLLDKIYFFTIPGFFIIFSLFCNITYVYLSTKKYIYSFNIKDYLIFFSFLFLFYVIRYVLIKISALLFNTKQSSREYIYNIFGFDTVLFIFLIFAMPVLFFNPGIIFLILSVFVVFIVHLIRFARGFLTGISVSGYLGYYFFLYFCTIEILPLLIIFKVGSILLK